jgi:methyl-accepting chemotaxis protein
MTSKDEGEKRSYKRRQYLIDRRRQLATTFRVAGLVFVLLLTLNAMVAWQSYNATASVMATDPAMGERMRAIDNRNLAITAGISLVILAMVVVRSIVLTHRTAGAVYKVSQCLGEVADFNFDVNLRLRNDDNLRGLEEPFNKMAGNLRRTTVENYASMKKLADEIEEHGNPVDAEMLRRIADSTMRRAK